ncbi:ABC transporter substrate-binding protein [Paenibacillus filicis]|uniref:ABC transporter substrate-binding protein n=1 Tax=Paenibacillus gyeongsangnamensis TaxID=3388067 RepID=A0ABT4QCJ8_9BACL|nr:ABC transporter substrate-binding protein [Paenibacillus filicis]MCZ8514576.1 ABC transporter substrate-binding protein [Paenibacillus filicis]
MAAAVAGLLSLTALLAGCGSPSPSAAPTASKDTAGAQAYTIKHAMGETKIAGTPKRVVILTNEGTEALFALGVKPVGAVKSWSGNPWYEHLTKRMEGVEMVGDENQPNLEAIAKLKPDLILGNKLRQEKVYPQLSAIAPTVFTERLQSDWQKNFKVYAEALGLKAEGDKLLAQYDQRIADMKAKAGDSLKTKVSLVRFIPGKTRLYMKDTFAGFALDRIGFARPDAQNRNEFMQEITKERIPDMDGDVIFYFTWDNDKKEASAAEKEWTTDPLWTNLNAVKKGKAFRVSDDIWNSSGGIIAANLMLDDVQKYLLKP